MKKFLALFLALLMVFSLLPVSALADGEVPEEPTEALEEALPAEEPAEEALPEEPAEEVISVAPEEIPAEEPSAPAEEPAEEEALPEAPVEQVLLAEEPGDITLLAVPEPTDQILTSEYIPDEAFRRTLIEIFSPWLTLREARDVDKLNLSGKGIADLTGIEFFRDLDSLDVSGNALTALDASVFPSLVSLDCSGNNLTSLNVSGCLGLRDLNCSGNALTSLTVSGCGYLKTLNCSSNALTSLTGLSNLPKLVTLNCSGNALASLDVSGCTALQYLDCSDNALVSLNVSGCTLLSSLTCDGNNLTALDVSGCKYLESVNCSKNALTELKVSGTPVETLDCSENDFTSLDLSGCKYLESVNCSKNALTELKVSGTRVETLTCTDNALTSLDLSGCTYLQTLTCSGNALTSLDVSGRKYLQTLTCSGNALTSLNVSDTNLYTLTCSNNALTSLNVSGRIFLLTLDCSGNALTALDVSGCENLEELNCSGNALTALDVSGTDLRTLTCSGNALTALDVSGLFYLTNVDCSGNALTELTGLKGHGYLTDVDCSENALTALDVSGCPVLDFLGCSENALTSLDLSGCTALGTLYCGNNKLMDLDLTGLAELWDCDLGIQYPDNPADAVALRMGTHTVSVAVLEETAAGKYADDEAEGCWESFGVDMPIVVTEGTPDRCIYALECRTTYGPAAMLVSRPVEYTEAAIRVAPDYILMDLGHEPVAIAPELPAAVEKLMELGLLTLDCTACDADNPEECTVVELDGFAIAPKTVGTAWLDVNLMLLADVNLTNLTLPGGTSLQTARVRVDVVKEAPGLEVMEATLPVSTASVELYKTDYTEFDVVLDLKQWHREEDPSLLGEVLDAPEPEAYGVTVESAEFTDAVAKELFILVPVSDRRLAIVPINGPGTGDYIDLIYSGAMKAPKKLSSQIQLTLSDGTPVTTEQALTLTLKTSRPKLKAAAVKFNSLLAEEKLLAVTGGEVLNAEVVSGPDWAELGETGQGFTLRYAGAAGAKLSGKLTLDCELEGWAVTAPVTVKLSASAVKPKLTFAKKSLTLEAGSEYSAELAPAITPADFIGDFRLVSVVDAAAKQPVKPDGETVPSVDCGASLDISGKLCPYVKIKAPASAADGKAHSYKYTFSAGSTTAAVTVKVLPAASSVKLTVKTAGAITVPMPLSTVTLTPTLKNAAKNPDGSVNVWLRPRIERVLPDGTREPVEREFLFLEELSGAVDYEREAFPFGPLHLLESFPEHVPDPAYTYYVILEAVNAQGETLAETEVRIPVQASAAVPDLKVKLSGKLDPLREGSEVKVKVTAENCLAVNSVLDMEVYKVFDGLTGQAVMEDVTDLFWNSLEDEAGKEREKEGSYGGFTLRLAEGAGGEIHPKDKFSLRVILPDPFSSDPLAVPLMKAAPVNLPITVGKAALKLAPAKAEMVLGDPYAEVPLAVTWADAALRGIARVELNAASDKLFDLAANADGTYSLHWDNNKFPVGLKSGKTVAVKLNVWLQGNELGKPLTLTLKVTVR